MASINGVTIKNLKSFYGYDGYELYQGHIYIDNKKVGFWSQDAHGGVCDNYEPWNDWSEFDKRVELYKKGYSPDYTYYSFLRRESLMENLLQLVEDEKRYKKFSKVGRNVLVVVTDEYVFNYLGANIPEAADMSDEAIIEYLSDAINTSKKDLAYDREPIVIIYRSLSDFDIVVDENNPVPNWKQQKL